MAILLFLLSALMSVLASIKLSSYADVLSERSKWGTAFIGAFLLAGATTLPEVTTSWVALSVDNREIAAGNMFGSNGFNLLILAIAHIIFTRHRLLEQSFLFVRGPFIMSFSVTLLLWIDTQVDSIWDERLYIGWSSIAAVIFFFIYFLYQHFQKKHPLADNENDESFHTRAISVRKAKYGFFISTVLILIFGSTLALSGDYIAKTTTISSSFIGTVAIACATSLPEAVSVYVALGLKNVRLAIAMLFGSNIMNLFLFIALDVSDLNGPLLSSVEHGQYITLLMLLAFHVIIFLNANRDPKGKALSIGSALIMIALYLSMNYLLFVS
ncbi:sodium:calcium antiporter [Texcoconibacillus texcoconensis]|uniref:Cation:H+ antiporter n=1 Tax=Texcoconibacillus texcoconensis TaxID=1095777 RepID=A0A840QTY0_9BACI|nr:sodium:calcium antiporter [Texcoconibacillus texcoconensis]MBB5174835.1 cation:H+ antiporter [Texcoconibacillus texcoconensis]